MESIKLQKFVSECGLMSRRKAEEEIAAGHFEVDGVKAQPGMRIAPAEATVTYKGKLIEKVERKLYFKFFKPRGCVSTMSDEKGRKGIGDIVAELPERVYPIGRLDLDSEGLVILTNDGELANKLMHPSGECEKVYVVRLKEEPDQDQLKALNSSMEIDGYKIRPCKVGHFAGYDKLTYRFALREGRNRQIRKMCEKVGLGVARLTRISEGEVTLGNMKSGEIRKLDKKELDYLKSL
ncbi:MAG: rRNA pseudouridine synthase [Clostridia bacterium]|nr:rRNA pseudouridine synthase [Clostridia bacterium]